MKLLKPILIALILCAGVITLKKTVLSSKDKKISKYGHYLSCHGDPYDYRVKHSSVVYLLKEATPTEEKDKTNLFHAAIFYQNMYAFSNLHDYNQYQQNIKWASLSDSLPAIKIVKVEESTYPASTVIPSDTKLIAFPPEPTSYVNSLIKLGQTTKGAPAWKVTYEYENDLLLCFAKENPDVSKLKIVHPLDPYTAFFVVPEESKRLVSNPARETKQKINPCIDPEILSPSSFYPFLYWYAWRPFAESRDFKCSDFYKEDETIKTIHPVYTENAPKEVHPLNLLAFENMNRPLNIAVYLGTQETKAYKKLDTQIGKEYITRFLSGIDISSARNDLPPEGKFDHKFSTMLWLMRNTTEQMNVKKTDIYVEESFVRVEVKGQLKLSRKDVAIKFYLVQIHSELDGADQFAKAFADDFLNHDIVIYEGHVANGNVFSDSIAKYRDQMMSKMDKSIQYQIFALHSCSANFFFRPESFPEIQNEQFERDYIRTSGGFLDGTGNSTLTLIGQVDSYLYNKSYVHFSDWSRITKTDNFYILSNN